MPDSCRVIVAGSHEPYAVGVKRHAVERQRMAAKVCKLLKCGGIPEFYRVVETCSRQASPVAAERDRLDIVGMSAQRPYFLARGKVPHLGNPVHTSRHEKFSIRTECKGQHHVVVWKGRDLWVTRVCIPNARCLVVAARRQPAAVFAESNTSDPSVMILAPQQFARLYFPEPD